MMEGRLARVQLHGNRPKGLLLLVGQHGLDGLHVSGEARYRQEIPPMASGHVLDAAVLEGGIIQPDPARKVRERLRARPVGVVLMPGDYATVLRRLAE